MEKGLRGPSRTIGGCCCSSGDDCDWDQGGSNRICKDLSVSRYIFEIEPVGFAFMEVVSQKGGGAWEVFRFFWPGKVR